MRLSKMKLRLLSGLLCACMVFQSLTVTAFASEVDGNLQVTDIQEVSEVAETEIPVAEDVTGGNAEDAETSKEVSALAVSAGDAMDMAEEATDVAEVPVETEPSAEIITEEAVAPNTNLQTTTESSPFSDVKMIFSGFSVYIVEGTYTLTDSAFYDCLYLACYDEENNLQSRERISATYASNADSEGKISIPGSNGGYPSSAHVLHKDTAYVQIEALGYGGNVRASSESYEVAGSYPDITFTLDEMTVGSGYADMLFSYDGTMKMYGYSFGYSGMTGLGQAIYVDLNYGTTQDESTWETKTVYTHYSAYLDDEETVLVTGLEPNTKYYGKVRLYTRINDVVTGEYIYPWEQEIALAPFTTKESNTYNLKTAFPDDAFRAIVLNQLGSAYTEDSDVTAEQLEKITSIHGLRSSLDTAAVKDITGVELLTGLTLLYLDRHEIASVDEIDWSKLTRLEYLSFVGNELTTLPDLTKNTRLSYFNFGENLLTDEKIIEEMQDVPANINIYNTVFTNQRANGFELLVDENYYIYGTAVPFKVTVNGIKSQLGYTTKTYIDEVETTMTESGTSLSIADAGLSVGEHTVRAELYSGDTKVDETESYTFNVVDESFYMEEDVLYCNSENASSSIYVVFYSTESQGVSSMSIVDAAGTVYADSTSVSAYSTTSDNRYKVNTYDSNRVLYRYYSNLNRKYNVIPAGSYNVLITYSDGTTKLIENYVQMIGAADAVITDCSSSSSYDNSDEYIYLLLRGNNIKPDKLNYDLTWKGHKLSTSYVSYKEVSNGVIVKLQREAWINYIISDSEITISPKSGYELVNNTLISDSINKYNNVFYTAYNPVTEQVEAAFCESLEAEGRTIDVELALGYNEATYPAVAFGRGKVIDGIAYFDIYGADGEKYDFSRQTYYARFRVNGTKCSSSFYASVNSSSVDYWSVNDVLVNTEEISTYYYSDMEYGTVADSDFTATIEGDNVEAQAAQKVWTYERNGNTVIGTRYAGTSLTAGTYTVKLYYNSELLSSTTFDVKEPTAFVLNSISSTSWQDNSTFSVYLNTLMTREEDEYEVILTDYAGNAVEELETTVNNRYSNGLYLYVTGLAYEDAQRYYYIKVVHKTLGEAVKADGSSYFNDEKGEYRQIYSSSKSSVYTFNNRGIGVGNMTKLKLPVTLKVYKPYDTDVVLEHTIESVEEGATHYYLPVSFCESLPNADARYDLTVLDADGYIGVHTGIVFGSKFGDVSETWTHSINRTNLYINTEDENTATIQVNNSKANPTFKSSDTSIVTVKADANDKKKAIVTAVGVGIATITITADDISKEITVVVDRKVELEGLTWNKTEISLTEGNSQELIINTLPVEAWSDDLDISYDVSGSDVVSIERSGNVVTVTALGRGKATITAGLTINGKTYTCQCDVTVQGAYTQAEKNNMAKASVRSVLLNTFVNSAVTLKDVELPANWTWVDGSIKLTADDANPIQYYAAVYEEEGYESFVGQIPVRVSKLTGIIIEGKDSLVSGTTDAYDVAYKYTGYQPTETVAEIFESYYSYEWTASGKTPYVTIKAANEGFTAKITTNEVTAIKSQTVKVDVTVAGSNNKVSGSKKITITPEAYVDGITAIMAPPASEEEAKAWVPSSYNATSKIFTVDLANITDTRNIIQFAAGAQKSGNNTDVAMKWTSTDTSVATVKYADNGKSIKITVKKAGSAVIKATAQDKGKYTEEFVVIVKDYAPIVESKTLGLNLYSTEGAELLIHAQNGNAITKVELLEDGVASSKLAVTEADGKYFVKAAEGNGITKKTTVKPILRITTADGKAYDQIITVNVAVTKPTASLKVKSKANLFYTDAEAVYAINSKYEISSIEEIGSPDGQKFHLGEYLAGEKLVTFDTNGTLNDTTYVVYTNSKTKKVACAVKVKVFFAGYTEEAAQTITVNVATVNTKPSLKLNDITFVPGVTEGIAQVYDTKAKAVYALTDTESIVVTSDNSKTNDVIAVRSGESIKVTYDGTKTATYKAALSSANWTQKLTLSGKVNVLAQQSLVLGTSKVSLNTATSIQKNGTTAIDVAVKNNDAEIKTITYQTDKKSAALINSGYLSVTYDEAGQQLHVGLNEGKRGSIKAGTYKLSIGGTVEIDGKEVSIKKTTLSVALVDKAPTVKLSAKGKIDLVQREETSIIYTPTLSNVTATVTAVSLDGAYAKYFEAELVDGKVEISANLYRAMSTKVSYPVKVVLTLDNGMKVSATVKIKPVSTTPKVTAGLTKGILYRAADNAYTFGLKTNVAAAEIEKIVQVTDKNSKYFNVSYNEETEQITISLSEEAAKLKPGKYTVSYQVYFEGAAYNAKPVTVKFTATVK